MFKDKIEYRKITGEEKAKMEKFCYGYLEGINPVEPHVWVKVFYDKENKALYILDEIHIYNVAVRQIPRLIEIKERIIKKDCLKTNSYEFRSLVWGGLHVLYIHFKPNLINTGINWLKKLNKIIINKDKALYCLKDFYGYKTDYYIDENNNKVECNPIDKFESVRAVIYALHGYIN